MAEQFFVKKKYTRAQQVYEDIMPYFKTTMTFEDIYYKYAYCAYYLEDYLNSENLFKTFLEIFPNSKKAEDLYKRFPKLETVSRKVMEKVFAEQQEISGSYFTDTPEQRYLKLLKSRPELFQKMPQYQIASYVGVKPESLSRIRKRQLRK